MIKRFVLIAAGAVAVLVLVTWAGLGSYVSTAWHNVRVNAKKQVPLEFEIDRVRNEVAQLVPDMQKNCRVVAEETVAVQNLKDEIAAAKTNLAHQKENLKTMAADLESGAEAISYGGQEYSRVRVSQKLERDLGTCKRIEEEIKSKEQLLEARERGLDAAKEQLATIRSQKQDLEVQVEQLEANLKTVRLAQTRSKFEFDDSRLAQCKASISDIRNRLKAEEETGKLMDQFASDPIPVEKKAKSDQQLTKEVKDFLGENKVEVTKVAVDHK